MTQQVVLTKEKTDLSIVARLRESFFGERNGDIYAPSLKPGDRRLTHRAAVITARGQVNERLPRLTDRRGGRQKAVPRGFYGQGYKEIFAARRRLSRVADKYEGSANELNELHAGLRGPP